MDILRDFTIKNIFLEGGEIFGPLKSELDELQEEVARRAHEQELRRKREKEKEAAMGFNPRPSRFMDLDELQNQGNLLNAVYFARLWCWIFFEPLNLIFYYMSLPTHPVLEFCIFS